MKKEKLKSNVFISTKQKQTKTKLIPFSFGISENNTKQNSFRKINDLKFKTTKNSPDKNEDKKIIQQTNDLQRQTDEFLKQHLLKKKETITLKKTNFLNFSNSTRKSNSNNNNNSNSNDNKHHLNIIPTNLNYQKACIINSGITSPRQSHCKQKVNSSLSNNQNKIKINNKIIKDNNSNLNDNDSKIINNNENNILNISVQNNNNNKERKSISSTNKNNFINNDKKEDKNLKILNKHKISQTTPVTNVNSRKTSNEKKINHHNFIQNKKNSILTNLTHNKNSNFQTSNTEEFYSHSSIHNLKTNYSNDKYIPLKQNNISKTLLTQSNSFKPHFTTENSPHYYKKNFIKKNTLKNENILKKYNLKPSSINVKKGNYTSSTSKEVLRHNNLGINRKIISTSKTSTHSLSKTISHKSSLNKIQYMTLSINKKNIIIPKSGKNNFTENNSKIKNKNVINKISRTTNTIPNKTKKIVKENIKLKKEIIMNKIKKEEKHNKIISNSNISLSTFKDDENLNESKIILKNEMIKEGIYYLKESEKLSTYLKKYYNKYHEYPKTKLAFYKFGHLIGRGAFGKVNLGLHVLSGRTVAIKSFNKTKLKNQESIDKIYQEINLLKIFRHNSIVRILEYIETEKYILIIMENISGGDLLSFVKKRTKLNEKTAQFIFKQLISTLKFIHSKGIIHRDIKLDNILIDLNNNIKICDFGVGKQYKKNEKLNDQCGTPAYIAPEILQNNGYYGPPVDIWSSGVVLYAMLSGNVPFKANNLKDLHKLIINGKFPYIKDISNDARNLIRKILEVDPCKRIDIDGIFNHPWMVNNNNFDEGKNCLFTKAEIVLLSKENVDYRFCDKSEMIENFTIKNLYTLNDKENKNINTKSIILAPFNSSYESNVNLNHLEKSIEIYNDVIQFSENTKLLNRNYELNNNGEIDHGVLINQNNDDEKDDIHELRLNDLDDELEEINKNNIPDINKINIQNNDILVKPNSKRNESNLTNSSTFIIDENILKTMEILGYKKDYIQKTLNNNELNYASATYYLLSNQNDIN